MMALSTWQWNDLANTLTILNGDGTGGFTLGSTTEVGVSPKNIALGDLNQDGISDLAVACVLGETVTLLFADGEGGFTDSSYQVDGGPFAVAIEDFDGDGKKDLALADGINDNVAILLNTGMGNFAEAQTFPAGLAPHDIVSGDFNSDGRLDLAVVNTGDSSVTILLQRNSSTGERTCGFCDSGTVFKFLPRPDYIYCRPTIKTFSHLG